MKRSLDMNVREILTYPSPLLKEKSVDVKKIDEETRQIINDMVVTMYHEQGVGLAAPQIGVLLNIITVDVSMKEEGSNLIILVNPKITKKEGTIVFEEGCLSVPDFLVKVKRSCDIVVNGLNEKGEEIEITCNGLLSVVLQHEIDHLSGILIVDYASQLKKSFYSKKLKKKEKKARKLL
jgi:peptide deformylase